MDILRGIVSVITILLSISLVIAIPVALWTNNPTETIIGVYALGVLITVDTMIKEINNK